LNQSTTSNQEEKLGYQRIDPLTGIDLSKNSYPGSGRVDILTGAKTLDIFVLGNTNKTFYNDSNNPVNTGQGYAQIKNFDSKIDKVQLNGKATDYVLGSTQQGLGIYVKTSGQNELIGILEGINSNNFNLNTNAIYVGQ
jgi:hypothetical protein